MPYIKKIYYVNGKAQLLVEDVDIDQATSLMINNGIPVEVDMNIVDERKISTKQRKMIFALLNDIHNHTGQPQEYLRSMFMFYISTLRDYENFSLSNCDMSQAKELIELIINWVFLHDIPLNYKTSNLMRNEKEFLYVATINRTCVICGKPKSDLAHRQAVGSGRNRNTINHIGAEILALCRQHHNEQHQIGVDAFDDKYHLKGAWITVDERLNKMLRGQTTK